MIVVDANVILSALRSSRGASHWLLRMMLQGVVPFALSPAVALEYEDVIKRPGILGDHPWISMKEIDTVLDALCSKAALTMPWFRFRPFLDDPGDDIYIECALTAGADIIISRDRHFAIAEVTAFGLTVLTAGAYAQTWMKRRQEQ